MRGLRPNCLLWQEGRHGKCRSLRCSGCRLCCSCCLRLFPQLPQIWSEVLLRWDGGGRLWPSLCLGRQGGQSACGLLLLLPCLTFSGLCACSCEVSAVVRAGQIFGNLSWRRGGHEGPKASNKEASKQVRQIDPPSHKFQKKQTPLSAASAGAGERGIRRGRAGEIGGELRVLTESPLAQGFS